MQLFLGSIRSPALFNIIINITLLKNLENYTCSYILSSFYMAATVANEEGTFDMKMQDIWALKSLNCRGFRAASPPCPPPPPPPPGLRPGPDLGPRRSPDPSPNFAPSKPKTWIRAWLNNSTEGNRHRDSPISESTNSTQESLNSPRSRRSISTDIGY